MAQVQAWMWMFFLLFIITSRTATRETFHIIPSTDTPCPGRLTGEPCFTLQQYVSGEYREYTSNPSEIHLEFQPGRHTLDNFNPNIIGTQLVSFTMNSLTVNSTEIYCYSSRSEVYLFINHVQNVHISGINFTRCSYRIETVMNLTLEECSFSQVYSSDALYIRSSSATIKRCTFMYNNYIALHTNTSSVIIDYSSFVDNIGREASILIENGHNKNVTISNSDFSRNGADFNRYYGEGMLSVFTRYLEIYNTTFVSNRGGYRGALAVQNEQSVVNISQCNFVNNRAGYKGGAVFIRSYFITIQQSTFSDNRAGSMARWRWITGDGGAIYVTGMSASLFIQQNKFMSNQAGNGNGGHGGAIHITGRNNSLSIDGSEFMNNTIYGAGNGGAIYVNGGNSSVSIYQSMIDKNSITAGNGGAIYVNGGNTSVSIYQSMIDKNSITAGNGSAVFLGGDKSRILIEQSSLTNNKALIKSGGAIYTNGQNTHTSITESTISNNSAAKCGAIAINNLQHYNVKFKNSMFINNSAVTNSGGVMCIRNASILIMNCTFSHNRAEGNAGVFAVDDSTVTIQGSTFDNNTAGANGGVVATEYFRTALFISHTSFTNNQGNSQGGVMYVGRKGSQVKIDRSTISLNNASRGGFATVLGSSLEITVTNISNNTAESGEVISACNSDVIVSEQLLTSTDPVYSVCTLFNGDINETDPKITTTTDTLVTTTTTDIPITTSKLTPETTAMSATTSLPTEPSIISSVYFELNGESYPNNSAIPLSEVGENEHALLCKTDLTTCCATPPNRFGEFYYPNGVTVSVKKVGHGFYRDRGAQVVRLNRREGITSPSGRFRCAVLDASGTTQNLFIRLLNDVINNEQN